jgi:Flp pilus assembly pilin Flp
MLLGFLRDDSGATMAEYALVATLIAIVCITTVTLIGTHASSFFHDAASSV